MEYIAILGSTGSIGKNSLDVIRNFKKNFKVLGLSTNSDIKTLFAQIKEFKPELVCVKDVQAGRVLQKKLKGSLKVLFREDGLDQLATDKRLKKIVLAISGSAALRPLLAAIDSGKDVALANKEALVMAGPLIMQRAKDKKVRIIPIDSEQSAIWQCIGARGKNKLKTIYLTASGGPLYKSSRRSMQKVSVESVLKHPRWKMGRKISVDSATLMNKGLELLEAMYLFNVGHEKIKIIIHPEAIIHSMVEFIDGVILAQLSATDMRIPIQYALTYPERLENRSLPGIDFYKIKSLNFSKPDFKKFPCLGLAWRAATTGGTMPCVLNAANEVSVEEFLKKKLRFVSIAGVIERVINLHKNNPHPDLDDILEADSWARETAKRIIVKKE